MVFWKYSFQKDYVLWEINPLLLKPLKYHVLENFMENGAFALLEQMLHFP